MMLYHWLYLSRTTRAWSQSDLEKLVDVSWTRNTQDGVMGLLLYGNGHFIQLLEGRRQRLSLTFERIARDERHGQVEVLLDGPTARRAFGEWAMGLLNVDHGAEIDRDRFQRVISAFSAGTGPVAENALAVELLKEFRAVRPGLT